MLENQHKRGTLVVHLRCEILEPETAEVRVAENDKGEASLLQTNDEAATEVNEETTEKTDDEDASEDEDEDTTEYHLNAI